MNGCLDLAVLREIPRHRRDALGEVHEALIAARTVVLTTHVNADGDGAGCEAALGAWLAERAIEVTIVNPTPFPEPFRWLLDSATRVLDWGNPGAADVVASADLMLVLDTGELHRIAPIGEHHPRASTLVIDHHPAGRASISERGLMDPTAAATGELVYDLLQLDEHPVPSTALLGIYVAIVTDTGSFRFSNTTPRAHLITAELLAQGVDPERVYQQLFATVPRRRIELLREALTTLDQEPETGISWIVVPDRLITSLGATAEDLDGLVEHARSLEGTRVALLFREMPDGSTKVSFRSSGSLDVNRVARRFDGGGHVKAAGATLPHPPATAIPMVLAAVREELREVRRET
jgi:bifunctional oligoribonuclease and PAP phosphatase NrnA